jgi:hypothetical protein
MKKLLISTALISSLFAGDFFVGINGITGSGKVKVSTDSDYSYTFTDSEDISTSGYKLYVGSGKWYGFYQSGTISPDTHYMSDHDYTAFGIGYLYRSNPKKISVINARFIFDIGLGYDKLTSSGNTIYDKDKTGILVEFSAGGAFSLASFDKVSLNVGIGYELHAVKDSVSDSYGDGSGTWNFGSLIFTSGISYSF